MNILQDLNSLSDIAKLFAGLGVGLGYGAMLAAVSYAAVSLLIRRA